MRFFDRIKKQDNSSAEETNPANVGNDILAFSEQIILDTETDFEKKDAFTIPIAELSTLGSAAASLIPALRTVTQSMTVDTNGLYRIVNITADATLKAAKDGHFWASFKTANGAFKLAKLSQAGSLGAEATTVMPINPATIMLAAALLAIEKKLDNIAEMQKEIITFLKTEKESQIEADVKMLGSTLTEFKFNWDKEVFMTGHYKLALDVKRTAEKNLQAYQKELQNIKVKAPLVANANVQSTVETLLKKFKYYRMSLYLFSMSSFIELIILGDFREEHILKIRKDIEERSTRYREMYEVCSVYIEKVAGSGVEANVLKGIGNAGKAIGGFIGSIPLIKEGPVDEWLQDGGEALRKTAKGIEGNPVHALAAVNNPETRIFIEKMDMLNQICNYSSEICFDKEKIYLLAG